MTWSPLRTPIPLARRPYDVAFMVFFFINLSFVTYVVDLEQLVIANPDDYVQPLWPPAFLLDLVHWWGRNFDPLQWARPPWWRMTIWIDVLAFGPFYVAAIYAFYKGLDWIKNFGLVWAGLMIANVSIILFEEWLGPFATPERLVVFAANGPWLLFPFFVIARLWSEHPFTEPAR